MPDTKQPKRIRIQRGLDLPVAGAPRQSIHPGAPVEQVALLGPDYHGIRPNLAVQEGQQVKCGQLLFHDRNNPQVRYTAPGAGKILAIRRGAKRSLAALIISLEENGEQEANEQFPVFEPAELPRLSRDQIQQQLIASGLWTALRTRPFSKVPDPSSEPHSLFVNAMDTNPLAAQPEVVIAERKEDFLAGLQLLYTLAGKRLFLAKAPRADIPAPPQEAITTAEFAGPHPAGLSSTHIHFLDPVGPGKSVWSIAYQDVIACGRLFTSGRLPTERIVSLAGPGARKPRLLRTRLGADLRALCKEERRPGKMRIVSGSLLSGRAAKEPLHFLGRLHTQVCVLPEAEERRFLGWLSPGLQRHSVMGIYLSRWLARGRSLHMNSSTNGSPRAMVPIGAYEAVMPLDMLPTQLLRSLLIGDIEAAEQLGALELDEEDLALCTYVCPGKYDYGPALRTNLTRLEEEG